MNRFGQCCLLARRLIEAGVRFVTINTFLTVFDEITWDIHGSKPFTSIEGMRDIVCPMYDQAYSALIEDLHQRGHARQRRWSATWPSSAARRGSIPPAGATTGRSAGRSVSPAAASRGAGSSAAAIAIGGVPADRPVEPADIAATIFHSLGFNLETKLPGPPGGRSRWSISASARSTSCFKPSCDELGATQTSRAPPGMHRPASRFEQPARSRMHVDDCAAAVALRSPHRRSATGTRLSLAGWPLRPTSSLPTARSCCCPATSR